MGIYQRHILPLLTDWAMGQAVLAEYRERVVGQARGRVLEIGFGSGRNLPFYTRGAHTVVGVDPSPELLAIAHKARSSALPRVELLEQSAESLPFENECFDTAVVTWSLCTIPDPMAALREVRRVLKPGGQLLFVEHGASPDPAVRRWQERLTPLWARCAGGCHLNRNPADLIRLAGFGPGELRTGYARGFKSLAYMYEGSARAS